MEDREKELLRKVWEKALELRDAHAREGEIYANLILNRSFIPLVNEVESAIEKARQPKEKNHADHDDSSVPGEGPAPFPEHGPAP